MNKPTTIEEEEKINLFILFFFGCCESFNKISFAILPFNQQNDIHFKKDLLMMGTSEILVIMLVILILFGGKKLPEFAKSLGLGIKEFKKACHGDEENCHPKEVHSDEIDITETNEKKFNQ